MAPPAPSQGQALAASVAEDRETLPVLADYLEERGWLRGALASWQVESLVERLITCAPRPALARQLLACRLVELGLEIWETRVPRNASVRRAISTKRRWLAGHASDHELEQAKQTCELARRRTPRKVGAAALAVADAAAMVAARHERLEDVVRRVAAALAHRQTLEQPELAWDAAIEAAFVELLQPLVAFLEDR